MREQDVAGLDVSVNDPQRCAVFVGLVVSVFESTGDQRADASDDVPRYGFLVLIEVSAEALAEISTVDEFHGDVDKAFFLADVVELDDVGMVEACGEASFAQKAIAGGVRETFAVSDDLEGDLTPKAFGSRLFGFPKLGVCAPRNITAQDVAATRDLFSGCKLEGHPRPFFVGMLCCVRWG